MPSNFYTWPSTINQIDNLFHVPCLGAGAGQFVQIQILDVVCRGTTFERRRGILRRNGERPLTWISLASVLIAGNPIDDWTIWTCVVGTVLCQRQQCRSHLFELLCLPMKLGGTGKSKDLYVCA